MPLALTLAAALAARGAEIPYEKKESFDATYRAAKDALGVPTLHSWHVAGPFPNENGKGHATPYPPEKAPVDLGATYESAASPGPVSWRSIETFGDGVANDLSLFPRNDWITCYAYRRIDSPVERRLSVGLGSDDTLAVFLNGAKLLDRDVLRSLTPNEDRIELPLREGANDLLLKVTNAAGGFAFWFEPEPLLDAAKDREIRRLLTRDFPDDPRSGVPGLESDHYEIEPLRVSSRLLLEATGLDFLPDGTLAVATRRGDVVLFPKALEGDMTARLFATGLHEPGGLAVVDGEIYVVQKPELTRLKDLDGDGTCDVYETISNAWGMSTNFHEFAFGPLPDGAGGFYGTLGLAIVPGGATRTEQEKDRGSVWHVDRDGGFRVVARGLRAPNGIGKNLAGDVFFTDNQGDWIPACPVNHLKEGAFYGQRFALEDRSADVARTLPACWLPYNRVSNSASAIGAFPADGSFGPFEGQLLVGDMAKSTLIRVFLEKVSGEWQGACFPFRAGFASGVERFVFGPDRRLWVGETKRGWWAAGPKLFAIERVRYTGRAPFEAKAVRCTGRNSFEIEFTKPLDPRSVARPEALAATQFTYHYWATYGSPEIETRGLEIVSRELNPGGLSVVLRLSGLEAPRIVSFRMDGVRSIDGDRLLHPEGHYTLNAFPE